MTRLDTPIYCPAEASRLAGLTPSRVRRWLRGYSYPVEAGSRTTQAPVIQRADSAAAYVSFLDLIELLFVKASLEHGISLQKVRAALTEAQDRGEGDHPFARQKFFTDGRAVYLEVKENQESRLLELLSGGQWVFKEIVLSYAKQITFSERSGLAERWYPLGRRGRILIDPQFAFGSPTIDGAAIRTANVYDLYRAEGGRVEPVCSWFGLSAADVEAAVRFEKSFAAVPPTGSKLARSSPV